METNQQLDGLTIESMARSNGIDSVKKYFTIDHDAVKRLQLYNSEDYRRYIIDWKDAEAQCKIWRSLETPEMARKGHLHHSKHDWTQIPKLEFPGLLNLQMTHRFGPQWGSFRFLQYGIWYFYPKLRTTMKWYGKRYGLAKQIIGKNWNQKNT